MKKLLIVVILFYTSGLIFAGNTEPEKPLEVDLQYSHSTLGLNFLIRATDEGSVIVRFRNRDRDIVFEKSLYGSEVYKGTFNLKNLSQGHYYLEVRHSKQKVVREIHIKQTSLRTVSLD